MPLSPMHLRHPLPCPCPLQLLHLPHYAHHACAYLATPAPHHHHVFTLFSRARSSPLSCTHAPARRALFGHLTFLAMPNLTVPVATLLRPPHHPSLLCHVLPPTVPALRAVLVSTTTGGSSTNLTIIFLDSSDHVHSSSTFGATP